MKPIIFLDLDETLIHSVDWWHGLPPEGMKDVAEEYDIIDCVLGGGMYSYKIERYKTIVRPYADEFINRLRGGGYEVKICTAATMDYAIEICAGANFGFTHWDIVCRDMVQTMKYSDDDVGPYILVDNLDYYEYNTKNKLKALGPDSKFIHIPEFDMDHLDQDHKKVFDQVFNQIQDIT